MKKNTTLRTNKRPITKTGTKRVIPLGPTSLKVYNAIKGGKTTVSQIVSATGYTTGKVQGAIGRLKKLNKVYGFGPSTAHFYGLNITAAKKAYNAWKSSVKKAA